MDYRALGRTGLSVSSIGFGCGSTGGLLVRGAVEDQHAAIRLALEGGINYFDTAAQYGSGHSEINLGRTLNELGATPHLGTKLRVEPNEVEYAGAVLRIKLEECLARLGRKNVDLCTLHSRVGTDPKQLRAAQVVGPIADAMRNLVSLGLTGAIGFTGLGETSELRVVAESGRFDTFQCYYNLLNQSAAVPGSPDGLAQDFDGLLNVAAEHGTGAVGIRVLAGGALVEGEDRHAVAGRIGGAMAAGEEYSTDRARALIYRKQLGALGVTNLTELAIRFGLANPNIATVLVGFSDATQVQAALDYQARGPLPDTALELLHTFD